MQTAPEETITLVGVRLGADLPQLTPRGLNEAGELDWA